MKRITLSLAVVFALILGGAFASTASAHGPSGHGHGHSHGHHHHGHHHHHHGRPVYGGYYAPYSYGYSTSPGYYYARPQPRVGFYFGF